MTQSVASEGLSTAASAASSVTKGFGRLLPFY